MTTTHIDPAIARQVLELAKRTVSIPEIGMRTGLLDQEVRAILDEARRRQQPATPVHVVPPRPPTAQPPVGKLAAPGGSYVTVLRAGDLFADHTYQRPVDDRRVQKMVAEYNVALVGIVEVSDRGNGRYAIVDGQHRWAMLIELDTRSNDTPVCCRVHQGLTVEQEAALFRDIDKGRRALTTWDRWHARLAAAEPTVVAIDKTVRDRGLLLTDQIRPGTIRATKTCEDIEQIGGTQLLGEALDALLAAWGNGIDGFTAELLMGVALLRAGYTGVLLDRLVDQLTETTPRQTSARARALRETQSGSLGRLAAVHMVSLYNRTPGPKLGPLPGHAYFGELKRRKAKP